MKSYDEMAKNVLERRERYTERNWRIKRGLSVCCTCVCLFALVGVGGWQVAMQTKEPSYISPDNTAETGGTGLPETDAPIVVTEQPSADAVLDTTPGHDVGNVPTEIPDDVTVIQIPNSSGMMDVCIPVTTESLFENAELVVVGEFLGTDSTKVTDTLLFVSDGKVKINQVRKGEIETEEPLAISYYGGTATVAQIVSQVPSERLEKYGWLSMTKEEQQSFVVTYSSSLDSADLDEGETYLLFLSKNEYGYFVMCGSYGARHINEEGKVYNPDTRLYEDMPLYSQHDN